MKKMIVVLIALFLFFASVLGSAMASAAPSVTIGALVTPSGTIVSTQKPAADEKAAEETEASGMVVYLAPPQANETEQQVLESIVQHAESKPVAEYFAPEVIETVAAMLPAETKTEDLQMDEFFALKTEGYTSEYGDVQVAFEFATPYTEESKLVGMVGILPSAVEKVAAVFEAAGVEFTGNADENGVFWLAVKVEVINGKVIVHLPQGVMELTTEFETFFALLSVDEAAALVQPQ